MVVAPTPGFIGVYELFCATALWLWGVDKVDGTAFALTLHASQLLFTIAIGSITCAERRHQSTQLGK